MARARDPPDALAANGRHSAAPGGEADVHKEDGGCCQRGVQSVDQSIQMQGRNHWTSDAVVRFSNVSGEVVPPSGCAKAAAARMP